MPLEAGGVRRQLAVMAARLPDVQAGAPRKLVAEQRSEPLASELRAGLSEEEVQALIAQTAYLRARARGLERDYAQEDWVAAEAEVMTWLGLWP